MGDTNVIPLHRGFIRHIIFDVISERGLREDICDILEIMISEYERKPYDVTSPNVRMATIVATDVYLSQTQGEAQ